MKTMSIVCMMVMCLAGNAVSQDWDDFFKDTSEKKIASRKKEFKDPEKLKEALTKKLTLTVLKPPFYGISDFKERFDVQDEAIRSALLSLYREAEQNLASMRKNDTPDYYHNAFLRYHSVAAMGDFVNEPMKQFLYNLALDSTANPAPRDAAIGAYLGCANAREMKDFFVHFLSGKERFSDSIKDAVFKHIPFEEKDKYKREATLASLYVAAAQEEDWKQFNRVDWFLVTRRAQEYLTSHQRFALLKKHSVSEPEPEPRVHDPSIFVSRAPTLKERLGFVPSTNISTNLAELTARDFPTPSLPSDWRQFEAFSDEETVRLRELFKDEEHLRKCFIVLLQQVAPQDDAPLQFKRKFAVSDKTMQAVLLNIYKGSYWSAGWLDSEEAREVVRWLGFCADETTTTLTLPMLFGDGHYGDKIRIMAFESYLRCANSQVLEDLLAGFLTDKFRPDPLSMYTTTMRIYDEIKDDTQKQETIITAVSTALVKEEDKKAFAEADKLLAERSKEYADSPQRKAALERMNKPPENPTP